MMNKILRHDKNEFIINEFNEQEGFKIINKNKEYELNVIDKSITNIIIEKKFNKEYKRMLEKVFDETDNDDNGDLFRTINEYIIYFQSKYSKYLSKKDLNKYLKMLNLLLAELESKIKIRIEEKEKQR